MKENKFLFIIISTVFISCNIKESRVEDKIMECYYQSYKDDGIELKQLIFDYQKLLIDEEILLDSSNTSYRELLQNFENVNKPLKRPSKFFCIELQKIKKHDVSKYIQCRKKLINDSVNYNLFKTKKTEHSLLTRENRSLIAKDMLKVLSKRDFGIDFYKYKIFSLFCFIDTDTGVKKN